MTSEQEYQFFESPSQDRFLSLAMTIATELWVTKARLAKLEAQLVKNGGLQAEVMPLEPTNAERAEIQEELNRYVAGLMDSLKGQQASVPAADDVLSKFK